MNTLFIPYLVKRLWTFFKHRLIVLRLLPGGASQTICRVALSSPSLGQQSKQHFYDFAMHRCVTISKLKALKPRISGLKNGNAWFHIVVFWSCPTIFSLYSFTISLCFTTFSLTVGISDFLILTNLVCMNYDMMILSIFSICDKLVQVFYPFPIWLTFSY